MIGGRQVRCLICGDTLRKGATCSCGNLTIDAGNIEALDEDAIESWGGGYGSVIDGVKKSRIGSMDTWDLDDILEEMENEFRTTNFP